MKIQWDLAIARELVNQLDFSKADGMVVVITQDWQTGEVLMCAFANQEAILRSLTTGYAHYYSRTRKELWKKGETSGHLQEIQEVFIDCDNDTILFKINQIGAACHTNYKSCFYRRLLNTGTLESIGEKLSDL